MSTTTQVEQTIRAISAEAIEAALKQATERNGAAPTHKGSRNPTTEDVATALGMAYTVEEVRAALGSTVTSGVVRIHKDYAGAEDRYSIVPNENRLVLRNLDFNLDKKEFTAILDTLSSIVDECKFKVTEGNLDIRAVDPAHVCMVVINGNNGFGDANVGLDLDKAKDYVKRSNGRILLTSDDKENKLVWTNSDNVIRRMAVVDVSNFGEPKIPKMDALQTKFTATKEDVEAILKHAECVSDHVTIEAKGGIVTISAEGDIDRVHKELPLTATGPDAKSLFSLDYLQKVIKTVPASTKGTKAKSGTDSNVTFLIGTDYPVQFDWTPCLGFHATCLLAPRIPTE